MGAIQQASAYRYQAKIADRNAKLTSDQARMAQENSQIEQQRLGRKIAATRGSQIASMAANGVDIGFGSALSVQEDTAMLGAKDYNQLYRQSSQDQLGFDISVANDRAKAQGARQAATGALVKGAFDVAGTVLGGASQTSKLKAGSR